MHKRPKLQEALDLINKYVHFNQDCADVIEEYNTLKQNGQEFLAGRLVIDTVDHFYKANIAA